MHYTSRLCKRFCRKAVKLYTAPDKTTNIFYSYKRNKFYRSLLRIQIVQKWNSECYHVRKHRSVVKEKAAREGKFNKETESHEEGEKSVMLNGRAEFRMRTI